MASLDNQYISLGGQPILIDADGDLCRFLRSWFDPRMLDVVFQTRSRFQSDGSYFEGSAYEDFYPPLPDLNVNQYQIPTGLSRYSRGLFLVDRGAMARIAIQAYRGQQVSDNTTDQGLSSVIPELYTDLLFNSTIKWGIETLPVTLDFNFEHQYTEQVYPLRPIRIPYESRDAWLIPVVDYRYKSQFVIDTKDDKTIIKIGDQVTWQEYFEWAMPKVTTFSYRIITTSAAIGVPDKSVLNSRKPIVNTLDAMAVTTGYRYVPRYGMMNASTASSARQKQIDSDLIIAGGLSGQCDLPERVAVYGRKVRDWFGGYDWARLSVNNAVNAFPDLHEYSWRTSVQPPDEAAPKGFSLSIASLWNVNIPTSEGSSLPTNGDFEYFVIEFTDNCWMPWIRESLDITYAGIPKLLKDNGGPGDTYFLSGYDNWAIIDLGYGPEGQNRATTRVQSMPNSWTPKFLVSQDPNDITHYGPATFVSEENVPKAVAISETEWRLGQKKAFFMVLKPDGTNWRVKKTEVYANVHNSLGSTEAKANWPMQAKFIDGIWMIDVAECVVTEE